MGPISGRFKLCSNEHRKYIIYVVAENYIEEFSNGVTSRVIGFASKIR
jgi:hypothetical protein